MYLQLDTRHDITNEHIKSKALNLIHMVLQTSI
jgi:hypothetical protein